MHHQRAKECTTSEPLWVDALPEHPSTPWPRLRPLPELSCPPSPQPMNVFAVVNGTQGCNQGPKESIGCDRVRLSAARRQGPLAAWLPPLRPGELPAAGPSPGSTGAGSGEVEGKEKGGRGGDVTA